MDEPLSNLDAKLRVQMRAEIAKLQRDLGVTTFYVTHDQVEAMTMGDRVAVIKDGHLQQVDTPQNLYDFPDNVFVAAFIGSPSMNLYEGMLADGSITIGSNTLALNAEVFETRPDLRGFVGRQLIVGVRPEDMEDAAVKPEHPSDQCIHTAVKLVESLGSEVMVHFDIDATSVDSGDPDAAQDDGTHNGSAVGRFSPRSHARAGDNIVVAVDTARFHFFDPDSRLAIRG